MCGGVYGIGVLEYTGSTNVEDCMYYSVNMEYGSVLSVGVSVFVMWC